MSRHFKIKLEFIVFMLFWIILYVIAPHLINAFTQFFSLLCNYFICRSAHVTTLALKKLLLALPVLQVHIR